MVPPPVLIQVKIYIIHENTQNPTSKTVGFSLQSKDQTLVSCTGTAFRSSPPSSSSPHDSDIFILVPFFILHPHIQSSATPYQIECHFSNNQCFPFQLSTTIHIPSLQSALTHLLPSNSSSYISASSSPWHLGWGSTSISPDIASTFAVLKPLNQHSLSLRNIQCWDFNSLSAASSSTNTGATIQVLGCPFGTLVPFYFKNWHARGIISNTILVTTDSTTTTDAAIYMVDAKTLPGMEGSPVVVLDSDHSSFLGILLPPLRLSFHNNNNNIEVNMVAPIYSILHAMMSMMDIGIPTNGFINNHTTNNTYISRNGVVAVRERCSGSWASGIVMSNAGLILTVAHLLPTTTRKVGARIQIEVGVRGERRGRGSNSGDTQRSSSSSSINWLPATLIYKFTKALHLDVAIIQVGTKNDDVDWHPVPLPTTTTTTTTTTILEGRSINIVGYSLFNPSSLSSSSPSPSPVYISGPSVTVGTITRTIYHPLNKHTIVMVMTNAAVHGGGSGGAVVDSETGELIGMVTSNAKLKNPGNSDNIVVVIPDMSFVLPMNALLPIIHAVQGEGSKVDWGRYDVKDKVLESVWAMKDGGGGFGGARPPEALSRLMARLDEEEEEGSGGGNGVERSRL